MSILWCSSHIVLMYHSFGSHTGRAVGDISHFALHLPTNLLHSLQSWRQLHTLDTKAIEAHVRYANFVMLISECANVSHIWLPYWVRSRVFHSLSLVFYNEFDTFAIKLTTVTHFGHPAIGILVRYVNFVMLISQSEGSMARISKGCSNTNQQ